MLLRHRERSEGSPRQGGAARQATGFFASLRMTVNL